MRFQMVSFFHTAVFAVNQALLLFPWGAFLLKSWRYQPHTSKFRAAEDCWEILVPRSLHLRGLDREDAEVFVSLKRLCQMRENQEVQAVRRNIKVCCELMISTRT